MKVIHILLIVIFILFAILGMKIYKGNNKSEYSLVDIQRILDKVDNLKNYECSLPADSYIKYYKRKDNKVYTETEAGKSYTDYDSNIEYYCAINESGKYYMEQKIKRDFISSSNSCIGIISNNLLLDKEQIEIVDCKEEKYKENNCLKVELKNNRIETTNIFWINKENGLIMKVKNNDGEIIEYSYKFNTVTDDDVTPDLKGYKKVETK